MTIYTERQQVLKARVQLAGGQEGAPWGLLPAPSSGFPPQHQVPTREPCALPAWDRTGLRPSPAVEVQPRWEIGSAAPSFLYK